jgi:parvulin-like peptidyl-prolyl isomerase
LSRKLAHVAGAALASVLLLGGCAAGTHPGAAAVVGGTEITVGDVDETSRSVTTALGQPFTASLALSELVNSALVQQIADQRSVTVTDAELAPAMKAVVGDQAAYDKFVADPVAEAFLRDVASSAAAPASPTRTSSRPSRPAWSW